MKDVAIAAVLIIVAAAALAAFDIASRGFTGGTACTLEAKLCADGSYVGRNASSGCAFDACPGPAAAEPGTVAGPKAGAEQLAIKLSQAGLETEAAETIDQVFVPVQGMIMKVNGKAVQVYEFAGAAEAQQFSKSVSKDGTVIGKAIVGWTEPPHFYMSGSVVVIYIGNDAAVKAGLESAMGKQFAGAEEGERVYCPFEVQIAQACIQIYKPVCGRLFSGSTQTFSNSCFACGNAQVQYYTEGECAV